MVPLEGGSFIKGHSARVFRNLVFSISLDGAHPSSLKGISWALRWCRAL